MCYFMRAFLEEWWQYNRVIKCHFMKGKKIRKYTELFQPIFIDDKG